MDFNKFPKNLKRMGRDGLEQVKVHLPKDLKDKFTAKVKKESKTQTGVLRTLIRSYLKS
jgi:metal-responsive CopG/Arc/MetJ family transcriptional regulator